MLKILIVMSAVNFVQTKEGTKHPTGYFLSELAEPASALLEAGYSLTVATPNGVEPTMDKVSDSAQWFSSEHEYRAAKSVASKVLSQKPVSLEDLDEKALSEFSGIFFPGGHAPLEDLSKSADVARVVAFFHSSGRVAGFICHGPAALLAFRNSKELFPYKGFKMTSFSTAEERQEEDAGHLDGHMPFYLDEELAKLGAKVEVKAPWSSHAVRDRNLVTGQNPQSGKEFTRLFLEALSEKRTAMSR